MVIKLTLGAEDVEVIRNDIEGFAVETDTVVTIALVTELNQELIDEGFAREIVNKIQNMRKTSGFDVTDHIRVRVVSSDTLKTAADKYSDFIKSETLAEAVDFVDKAPDDNFMDWNINGEKAAIAVART